MAIVSTWDIVKIVFWYFATLAQSYFIFLGDFAQIGIKIDTQKCFFHFLNQTTLWCNAVIFLVSKRVPKSLQIPIGYIPSFLRIALVWFFFVWNHATKYHATQLARECLPGFARHATFCKGRLLVDRWLWYLYHMDKKLVPGGLEGFFSMSAAGGLAVCAGICSVLTNNKDRLKRASLFLFFVVCSVLARILHASDSSNIEVKVKTFVWLDAGVMIVFTSCLKVFFLALKCDKPSAMLIPEVLYLVLFRPANLAVFIALWSVDGLFDWIANKNIRETPEKPEKPERDKHRPIPAAALPAVVEVSANLEFPPEMTEMCRQVLNRLSQPSPPPKAVAKAAIWPAPPRALPPPPPVSRVVAEVVEVQTDDVVPEAAVSRKRGRSFAEPAILLDGPRVTRPKKKKKK